MSTTSITEVARGQPLVRFILAELRDGGPGHLNNTTGTTNNTGNTSLDLVELLTVIQAAVKAVSATLRSSGLVKWRSSRETAAEIFTNHLRSSQAIALLVCDEKPIPVEIDGERRGKYVVCVSPLDTEQETSDPPPVAGSIFSVHRYLEGRSPPLGSPCPANAGRPSLRSVLQAGRNLVAAGYALYGSSTSMVLSLGHGAHLFFLDPVLGEFILTAPNLTVPPRGHTYSVDEGFTYEWGDPVVEYVESKKDPKLGLGTTYRSHHVGSTVADVHNVLRNGGIYLSPQTRSNPHGKSTREQRSINKDRVAAEAELSASVAALSATIVALGGRPPSSRPTSAVYPSSVSPVPQRPASAAAGSSSPGAGNGGGGVPHSLPQAIPAKKNSVSQ